jgi:hypothetical protein
MPCFRDGSAAQGALAWQRTGVAGPALALGVYLGAMAFVHAVRVNETDTFGDEDGLNDEYFDFEDISGDLKTAPLLTPRPRGMCGMFGKVAWFRETRMRFVDVHHCIVYAWSYST